MALPPGAPFMGGAWERPLTYVTTDPEAPESLTPNHFLLGGSAAAPAPGTFNESDLNSRAQWRVSQQLADMFWSRWLREYLPELQHRREPHGRGEALKIGDVVLIADNTLPRNTWPRGVITAVYPGTDGVTGRRRPNKEWCTAKTHEEDSRHTNGTGRPPLRRYVAQQSTTYGGRMFGTAITEVEL
ncbi:hypothetical protein EVAR_77895_1 [Eumeta japonica]|uniref:DUF5641 domain-containing protein n=1 Tax=Eumeta variegata TaxID=151549 RepID=A0A4C1ZAI1_EUMVA|nr:hypothetical protein EVAR_77895_1 [Eumeta japonica]